MSDTILINNNDEPVGLEQHKAHYENMSLDEITKYMETQYKELSQKLPHLSLQSTSSTSSMTHSTTSINEDNMASPTSSVGVMLMDNEKAVLESTQLNNSTKKIKLNKIFSRAASSGDLEHVQRLLNPQNRYREYIDINVKDEDGTTPLIYASCFGKYTIVEELLKANADIHLQDSFGWSALMWATNNHHEQIVKLLLENGASSQQRSTKGSSVLDLVGQLDKKDFQKMTDIITTSSNHRDSTISNSSAFTDASSVMMRRSRTSTSTTDSFFDVPSQDLFYYQSTMENFDTFILDEVEKRQRLLDDEIVAHDFNDEQLDIMSNINIDGDDNVNDDENNNGDTLEFYWNKCLLDQMFVFDQEKLPTLLDNIINRPPKEEKENEKSADVVWVPANVLFLMARFAHYYCTIEVLDDVLNGALERINIIIQKSDKDIRLLTYWLTNFTQLLYYLKKDQGLVVSTASHQLKLSEMISETYTAMIHDVQSRLSKISAPALLGNYGLIPGIEDVHFADDWQRFFYNNSKRAISTTANDMTSTPRTMIHLLSSTCDILKSNQVQSTIIIQTMAQLLHFISCDLFNHVLTNKKLICRSKALQIRMNVSYIEDWLRNQTFHRVLSHYLTPCIQLLQLLQCISQLDSVQSLLDTMAACDTLNAFQVKRCIINYRYEVNELPISDQVTQYIIQLVDDMKQIRKLKNKNERRFSILTSEKLTRQYQSDIGQRQTIDSYQTSNEKRKSEEGGVALRRSISLSGKKRPESMYQVMGNFMSRSSSNHSIIDADNKQQEQQHDIEDNKINIVEIEVEEEHMQETKDTKFLLPFKVPTMAHMTYHLQDDINSKKSIPTIPDYWMDFLDQSQS
ncbi:unnamed protein product [Cunninghamella echinulata]